MFSARIIGMLLVAAAIIMAYNACAQWSPGGMMVYMGDLNLAGAAGTGGAAPYTVGSAPAGQPTLNNSSLNNTTMSSTVTTGNTAAITSTATVSNTATTGSTAAMGSTAAVGASGLAPLDLSHYGSDRVKGDLAKYKNIMYPIAESRGSTASTAGGASGGGGCGCG